MTAKTKPKSETKTSPSGDESDMDWLNEESIIADTEAPGNARRPIKNIKVGNIQCSLWNNEGKNKTTGEPYAFTTLSITRSFQKEGEWRSTTISLREREIPKLMMALSEGYHDLLFGAGGSQRSRDREKPVAGAVTEENDAMDDMP